MFKLITKFLIRVMTKEEKSRVIKDLATEIFENSSIYFTNIEGLNAKETSSLRRECFKENIKLEVVKNTLLKKAIESCERDFGELKSTLKGNTSLMFSEVSSAPAKLIKNFRKKLDKPILKGAFIQESVYIGDDKIDLLSKLKSKDELIGEVITILQSPSKNIITLLKSGDQKISGIIKTLSNR